MIVAQHQVNKFSAISVWEQVTFWRADDDVGSVLNQHASLDFDSDNSLKQQNESRYDATLIHIIQIPRQPVFALTR